ncbi:hypothetical protein [Erythrobacter phage vB_EliS-L02]|nr:hypothetical protein [Erythrobacter phage vB_EliS-L02]
MPKVLIEYTKTEITRERIWVEADNAADAVQGVEEYEFDNSEAYEVDSLRWEISDVEAVEVEEDEE